MILGIDASNIRSGGGVTHLVELLAAAEPAKHGFDKVVVWASGKTLSSLKDRDWLAKRFDPILEGHYLRRALWQRYKLGRLAEQEGCDLLFIPGGSFATEFRPIVTMSQNLLPFEWTELSRFGVSSVTLRLVLLRLSQSASFRKSDGVIFLTQYAQDAVLKATGALRGEVVVIPHGVNDRFRSRPRIHAMDVAHDNDNPVRLIYVSDVSVYKHQGHVVEAVANLRSQGLPVILDLLGHASPRALRRLRGVIQRFDSDFEFIRYHGVVPYIEIHSHYKSADICVFASSCENMPNILLEGMASRLPVACSERGPMPEVLGVAGVYFNPEDPEDIANALKKLAKSPELRANKAEAAYNRAQEYSWQRCADETFKFLSKIAAEFYRGSPSGNLTN